MLVALTIAVAYMPENSQAAVTPYFVAINDTLLPFRDDTMPFVSGGEIFISDKVFDFEGLGVWAISSDDLEFVRLYRGVSRYVDFYTARGVTEDQDGNTLFWPPARRVGSRFYLPLRQVCDYFGLTFQTTAISRDIIPEQQMYVVRIITTEPFINGETFVGMNRNAIRSAYNEYFAPALPPSPPPTGGAVSPPPPTEEPPPSFSDVTIHLSFYDISAGSAGGILDLLDIQAASGYHSGFFVSAADITEDPDLIRRVSGSGHTIGIWLSEGTFAEYLETSALLFEAAKVRTVLVSASEAEEAAIETAAANGLLFWESAHSLVDYNMLSVTAVTATIPQESGARRNLMFSCSENAASVLPGVYSFLRVNEYRVMRITETVEPIS